MENGKRRNEVNGYKNVIKNDLLLKIFRIFAP